MEMTLVQFNVDTELKEKASSVYENLGMDLSTALTIFLRRSVIANGIPFSMVLPEKSIERPKLMDYVKQLNREAERNGVSDLSLDEINAEIEAVRQEKSKRVA